ncbi:6-phosphogluconolactonase (cycloisomerase 2 family) [Kitasatospora sp. MAA4]|uniref:lactonase family protein n=1 Tax=Kitasatospora sp. MAA4 TaxID=3035093 RepID=UPI002475CD82|nr:beta-propeller fold lactonase family protein [Kitasatospora sp. MAA4]MDH6135730.1 6-phosphogluconolactonase (cycloisomerase 2 family) [Kitasatospora sp. MAA4]
MQTLTRLGIVAATALATTAALAPAAGAADHHGARHAVFVQTDNPAGNRIIAYHRGDDGRLTAAGSYDTGGLGGVLDGSVVDHLASQGSLTYDARHALLYAVNAGSDTVTVFSVDGEHLMKRQVIGSGGRFPVSVAVHEDTVYVLNALDGGSIQGFTVHDRRLSPRTDWNRCLGLDPNATPQFTNTPGQVGFAADGSQLVVTTKANGNSLLVFALDHEGAPADAPVVTVQPGAVPFGFVQHGPHLLVTQAGPNAVATVMVNPDGTATQSGAALTGQAATCWDTLIGRTVYASNAGSGTVSGFRIGDRGVLEPLGNTATHPGTVDSAASEDGRFLYVQTGAAGIVDEFQVNADGSLTALDSVTVPDAVGGEGIVAF